MPTPIFCSVSNPTLGDLIQHNGFICHHYTNDSHILASSLTYYINSRLIYTVSYSTPLSLVEKRIPPMSKTELWSPAPNCSSHCLPHLNIIQVSQIPDSESFLSIFLLSIAKSHLLYSQPICRMQQFLPTSAANSLVWARLTWIFARASELVSQLSHLPHRVRSQHRSQKDSLKINMRLDHSAARYSAMAFPESYRIPSEFVTQTYDSPCCHLPGLTCSPFFPHCGRLLNNPETCPGVSCLGALDSLSSLPPTILGLNPGLLRCRQTLYRATSKGHQGFNLPPLVAIAAILFKFIHWCRAGRWLLCDTVSFQNIT